ncbi:hypothetical protein [Wukongibacter sp. M2B1]|uniref:hypothetical protein n=1 Tax=Wukongibacter sp. M2B1 TaxID=3088895 RepID=UPI003D7A3578
MNNVTEQQEIFIDEPKKGMSLMNPFKVFEKGVRGAINCISDFAIKTGLPSHIILVILFIVMNMLFIFAVLILPLDFKSEAFAIITFNITTLVVIGMVFSLHKEKLRLEIRAKKKLEKSKSIKPKKMAQ